MEDQTIIDQLRRLVERLEKRIGELEAENRRLHQQVEEVQRQVARQAAPFRRPDEKKVPQSQRKKPGRKPGHPGACRAVPAQVDEEAEVPLEGCPRCGGPVEDISRLEQYIEEIPPVRPHVTKLTTYCGQCPKCGEVRSTHPLQTSTGQGASGTMLGPRALATVAVLNKQHGLTMRKTQKVLGDLCGLRVTPGGISQALSRVADKVEDLYDDLIDRVRTSAAVFADETSWWVGGPGWWLWTFTTPETTVYRVDKSRGSQVVREVLGDEFGGMLVSDCLSSYDPPDYRKHKCIAHHLRAIAKARERPDTKDPGYLDRWKQFFQTVIHLHRLRTIFPENSFQAERRHLHGECRELLEEARSQPGDLAVQNRLSKQWAHLLGCLDEPAAEPTNNRAERSLRPAVIARKVSCGNKSLRGRDCWQVLASLAATCQQRCVDFIDFLTPRLSLAPHAG
jgi:hypothetical protein